MHKNQTSKSNVLPNNRVLSTPVDDIQADAVDREVIRALHGSGRIDQRPAGARRVEPPRVFAAEVLHPPGQGLLPVAARFIARGKEHE